MKKNSPKRSRKAYGRLSDQTPEKKFSSLLKTIPDLYRFMSARNRYKKCRYRTGRENKIFLKNEPCSPLKNRNDEFFIEIRKVAEYLHTLPNAEKEILRSFLAGFFIDEIERYARTTRKQIAIVIEKSKIGLRNPKK